MALVLLAAEWARARGGDVLALVVDHGLRPDSAAEAMLTCRRVAACAIASRMLTLARIGRALTPGTAIAARARDARLGALIDAAKASGIVHLLLGHHAGDQVETLLIRRRAGSGPAGLAGIAALRETADLRILRPLLDVPAAALRQFLQDRSVDWTEDPSNHRPSSERARWRLSLAAAAAADGAVVTDLLAATRRAADLRTLDAVESAGVLARRVTISPLGYAILSPGPISPNALAALWQALAGACYPLSAASIARLAATPAPATLGGLRMLPAGRCGPGWLIVRERPPCAVAACDSAVWDRFVLHAPNLPPGLMIGSVGSHATALRRRCDLPASVLRTLPALFDSGALVAVPSLEPRSGVRFTLKPPVAAAGAPFRGVC